MPVSALSTSSAKPHALPALVTSASRPPGARGASTRAVVLSTGTLGSLRQDLQQIVPCLLELLYLPSLPSPTSQPSRQASIGFFLPLFTELV